MARPRGKYYLGACAGAPRWPAVGGVGPKSCSADSVEALLSLRLRFRPAFLWRRARLISDFLVNEAMEAEDIVGLANLVNIATVVNSLDQRVTSTVQARCRES